MTPLDFECRERLRQVKSGLDLLVEKLIPTERATDTSDLNTNRENTDYILETVRREVHKLLDEEQPPRPTVGFAEPIVPLGSIAPDA